MAGGSSAPKAAPSSRKLKPGSSSISSSSTSPMGRIDGRIIARPPDWRRKASDSVRTARRVGKRIVMSASAAPSKRPPSEASSLKARAITSAKASPEGIVKRAGAALRDEGAMVPV